MTYDKLQNINFQTTILTYCANKELRSIGIRTSISHRKNSLSFMLKRKVLIIKFWAINRFSSGTIVVCEISSLTHELRDHTMEGGTLVSISCFTSTKLAKVFCCLWCYISTKLKSNTANIFTTNFHVKKDCYVQRTRLHRY